MNRAVLALLTLCLLPAPAWGQSAAELLETAGKLMDGNEYDRAIETYGRIPDTATLKQRLDKHLGIASASMNRGRFTTVPDEISKGQALADQIGTPESHALVEQMQGVYLLKTRQGDLGLAHLTHVVAVAEQIGHRSLLTTAYTNLASSYQAFEDWERTTYYSKKAFELNPAPSETSRFNHLMGQGIAQYELYERDASETFYLDALKLARQMGAKRNEAWALGELGYTYWTFDRDQARALDHYTQSIARSEEARTPDVTATFVLNRGNVFRDSGNYEAALAEYRRVIKIHEISSLGFPFAAHKNTGQVYRLMGKPVEAIALLEPLIANQGRTASPRQLWQAHMELASAYAALERTEQAEASFKSMIATLDEQRNTSILAAFRTGSFAHALSLYDPYDRYIRFLLSGRAPRAAEALDIVERARARGFLESLASVRASVAAKLPESLLQRENEIRRAINDVQQQLRVTDLPRTDRERLLGELKRAETDRENFLLNMRVEHPALAEARYPVLMSGAELGKDLRPDETAVVFFLSEPESFRWTVTRDRMDVARLPGRAVIEKQAASLRALLRAPSDVAGVKTQGAALAQLLFDGLRVPGEGPVTIVPHGVLHYIPFETVPLDGALLIETHAVSYAPSLNALAYLRGTPKQSSPFRVLAVGNPKVASSSASPTRAGDVDNLALLGPLPFAERELGAIRETFWARTDVLSGASATESALRRESLDRFPVVHFATHGLVNDQHPKRSGLLLSPEGGDDGLLQMGEIYTLGLRANLVVLSACQTALGREITGEGIVGLSHAFFFAGARSVVSALWNLNDRFTSEFVERFYREIGSGRSPEDALRQTKLAYVNHAEFGHPFYWSSMVLTGDGSPTLATGPVGQPLWPKVLAAFLALAALGKFVQSRKNK